MIIILIAAAVVLAAAAAFTRWTVLPVTVAFTAGRRLGRATGRLAPLRTLLANGQVLQWFYRAGRCHPMDAREAHAAGWLEGREYERHQGRAESAQDGHPGG